MTMAAISSRSTSWRRGVTSSVRYRAPLLAVILILWGGLVHGAGRVALVIGNAEYEHVSNLPNPVNDATDIAGALERVGFDVTTALDLDYNGMRLALRDFAEAAETAGMALVYFAGHGIEIDNTNYLIPVNAELKSDRDIEFEAIRLSAVISALDNSTGVRIALLDACRNSPFLASMKRSSATRSIGRGLARVDPGAVLVGYAARGGTLALDGEGRNSPYAKALLTHIEEPGLELGFLFRKVRDTVFDLTDGYQEPFTYGSLPGEGIYLTAAPAPETVASLAQPRADTGEEVLYEAARMTGTPRAWAQYFGAYPRGVFRDEALEAEAKLFRENLQARHGGRDLSAVRPIDWMRREAVAYLGLGRAEQLVIQSALSRQGYDPGGIDGALGPNSFAAIADFQRDRRLLADGVLDRATLAALEIVQPGEIPFRVAATLGKRYRPEAIRALEPDPRLHRLVETFEGRVLNYGYDDGRLYAVVLTAHMPWVQLTATAEKAGGTLAAIGSRAEDAFVTDLFRYDNLFWVERRPRDTYPFNGDNGLDIIGPTFGMHLSGTTWSWSNGDASDFRNWRRGYPRTDRPRPYGEYVHGPRAEEALPSDWRWGNWHVSRKAILIEID